MKEIRSIGAEFRVAPDTRKIEGYALLFNTESQDLGGFKEIILPEAIDGVIERSDILATYQHDEDKVLARATNGSGSLSLSVDSKGLLYSFTAPKTSLGDEVLDGIKRGDLRNSSFAFTLAEGGQKWEKRGDSYLRTITQFDKLYDVAAVFRPAYQDTTVALRSLEEDRSKIELEISIEIDTTNEIEEPELPDTMPEPEENVIPNPNEDETESEFMGRCVGFLEGEGMENDQAVAICMGKWGERKDKTQEPEAKIADVPEADAMNAETIDIVYGEETYTIPLGLLEPYINDRKLERYITQMEECVRQLKK